VSCRTEESCRINGENSSKDMDFPTQLIFSTFISWSMNWVPLHPPTANGEEPLFLQVYLMQILSRRAAILKIFLSLNVEQPLQGMKYVWFNANCNEPFGFP